MTTAPTAYKADTLGNICVFIFTLLYCAVAAVYFFITKNNEFLLYVGVLLGIVALVALTLKWSKLPTWALAGLSVLGMLHIAGGGVIVNGDVLYNFVLIPVINQGESGITFWRYDQLVHPYGAAIAGLIVYYFIRDAKLPRFLIAVVVALSAMGVGALNEVLEFITKLVIPHTDVGGYDNTALDLVSNTVGGLIAAAIAYVRLPKVEKPLYP